MQTDHVYLLLYHWPLDGKYNETWRAMEAILKDGQARAIGVSNFNNERLTDLMDHGTIIPELNQIEFNPHIHHLKIVDFVIVIVFYTPLITMIAEQMVFVRKKHWK